MLQKKLIINLVIIVLCGLMAVSIPIITQYFQKSAHATTEETTTNDWQLVSIYVGEQYQNLLDTTLIWQLEKWQDDTLLSSWDEIYNSISHTNPLNYDRDHWQLTSYGLVYRGSQIPEHYQTVVIFQNHRCVIKAG